MPRSTLPLSLVSFSCPRTCPGAGEAFCRFRPLLDGLGAARVMSHTCTVEVAYSDPETLKRAVLAMGGLWYGWAEEHDLGDTKQQGWGFRLPMASGGYNRAEGVDGVRYWYHPLVLRPDGQLAYDEYGGVWGDVTQLPVLKEEYAIAHTIHRAELLGWQTERTPDGGVVVYHPQGGQLTLSREGACETLGFVGGACHEVRLSLGLPAVEGSINNKAECSQSIARAGVGVG